MSFFNIHYALYELSEQGQVLDQTQEFLIPEVNVFMPSRDVFIAIFRTSFQFMNSHIAINAVRMEDWLYAFKSGDVYLNMYSDDGKRAIEEFLQGDNNDHNSITLAISLPIGDHNVFDAVKRGHSRRRGREDPDEPQDRQRRRTIARRVHLRSVFTGDLDNPAVYQNDICFNACLSDAARQERNRDDYPMDYEIICMDRMPLPLRKNYDAAQIAILYAELIEGTNPILKKWRAKWLGRGKLNSGKIWNIVRGFVQSGKTAAAIVWCFFDMFRGMTACLSVRNKGGDQHMARLKSELNKFLNAVASYFRNGVDRRFVAGGGLNALEPSRVFYSATYLWVSGKNIKASWTPSRDQVPIFVDRYNKSQIERCVKFVVCMKRYTGNIKFSLIFDEDDEGIVSINSTGGAAQKASFGVNNEFNEVDELPNPEDLRTLRNQASQICSITATITNLLIVGQIGSEDDDAAEFRRNTIQLERDDAIYKGYKHPLFNVVLADEIDISVRHTAPYAFGECYALQRESGIANMIALANARFQENRTHVSAYVCAPATRLNRDRLDLVKTLPYMTAHGSVSFMVSENLRDIDEFDGKMAFFTHPDALQTVTLESIQNHWTDLQAMRPTEERVHFREITLEETQGVVYVNLKNNSQRFISIAYRFAEELSMLITGRQQRPYVICVTGSSYGSRCHTYKNDEHKYPITDAYVSWRSQNVLMNQRSVETVNWVNIIQAMRPFSCDNYNDLHRNLVMPTSCKDQYDDAFQGDQVLAEAALRVVGTLEDILKQLPEHGKYTDLLRGDAALCLTKATLMKPSLTRVNDGAAEAEGAPVDADWVDDEIEIRDDQQGHGNDNDIDMTTAMRQGHYRACLYVLYKYASSDRHNDLLTRQEIYDYLNQDGLFVTHPAEVSRESVVAPGNAFVCTVHLGQNPVIEYLARINRALVQSVNGTIVAKPGIILDNRATEKFYGLTASARAQCAAIFGNIEN